MASLLNTFHISREAVARLATSPVVSVTRGVPLRTVLELMRDQKLGAVTVCDRGQTVGIFTERDALRCLAEATDLETPIGDVASPGPVTVKKKDSLAEAISRMSYRGYRHLPLVDEDGQVVGMVDAINIIQWLVEHFPRAVYTLPPTPDVLIEREGP
ncbi:CBS domain-containing protein [Thermogutta sp.]|jgi:CBS domain-containing protein|uniref:CBS domain-containing protein n=1 Tax=Thermogutta sp. TaxID=1962930 RepID=UPI00322003CD